MEALKLRRKVLRTAFTRIANQLEEILDNAEFDAAEAESLRDIFQQKMDTLKPCDDEVFDLLLAENSGEDILNNEIIACDEYKLKFTRLMVRYNNSLEKNAVNSALISEAGNSAATSVTKQRRFKLPQIELVKFGGDVREWLAFWSSFKKIHEAADLDPEDKFQYLLTMITPNTRARDLIESFPPTAENYDKVIDSLKSRFGRDDLLVEVYVRELLRLVLNNAMASQSKCGIATLYDKIETQLRALETLGVNTETCSAMLYPLVESCLPEELLRVWQRSTEFSDKPDATLKNRLERLMRFMKSEVEGAERISLAVEGFGFSTSDVKSKKAKPKVSDQEIPTAAGLINFNVSVKCLFCEGNHATERCIKAQSLNFEEKRGTLKKKGACYRCAKIGHSSRTCRERLRCLMCRGQHLSLLCPNLAGRISNANEKVKTNQSDKPLQKAKDAKTETALANRTGTRVFLQTLIVKIRSETGEKEIRAIIDTGAQRSYVLKHVVRDLQMQPKRVETIVHALFGGSHTAEQEHSCYDVRLVSLDGNYACRFEALDQDIICNDILSVYPGVWTNELKRVNVELTDTKGCQPIALLIGADIAGKIFTGKKQTLPCGLVALETMLGWVLMGKIPGESKSQSTTMVVTNMLSKDASSSALWRLDPVERESKAELEMAEAQFDRRGWEDTGQTNNQGPVVPILGLHWNKEASTLAISGPPEDEVEVVTKRTILSFAHRLFDPIGFTSPATLCPKILLQEMWEQKVAWDEAVNDNIKGQIFYWSDSTTVLGWIRQTEEWAIFVGNRVQKIRSLTSIENWRHVPGEKNPADLPSRGCSPKALAESKWWEGPSWLYKDENEWFPKENEYNQEEIDKEKKKKVITTLLNASSFNSYFRYFSKYRQNVRLIAWIYRFTHNCRNKDKARRGELSAEETDYAERKLLWMVQRESFSKKDGRLATLNVFRDEEDMIRLETKISQKEDVRSFRHPYVLPGQHPVVRRLIYDTHVKSQHTGIQGMLTILRERYWILGGRRPIRSVISGCTTCKRYTAKPLEINAPSLPTDRVREAACFEVTGVDLAGPLYLKGDKKAWICLFTCAVYRAVHLEIVTTLSTPGFIQAFRRFVARRGRPRVIYSDNGTNFVGTDNIFRSLNWEEIKKYSADERICWRFNPPTSPWWGGWWERLIGLLKQLLRRVLGRARLNGEELYTILCDCEAVINSRPLTYVSNESKDLNALTPNMFLRELRESGVPDCDLADSCSLNRRFRYLQTVREEIRKRFRTEYLGQLRQVINAKESRSVAIDEIVLIGNDNTKRLDWPLGRVIELLVGKDNKVRLVRVKTQHGHMVRPIQHIYPLECHIPTATAHVEPTETTKESEVPAAPQTPVFSENVKCDVKCSGPDSEKVSRYGRKLKAPERLSYP